jgi:hypothetical protein
MRLNIFSNVYCIACLLSWIFNRLPIKLIQQIFTEFICARYYLRHWEYSSEQKRQKPLPLGSLHSGGLTWFCMSDSYVINVKLSFIKWLLCVARVTGMNLHAQLILCDRFSLFSPAGFKPWSSYFHLQMTSYTWEFTLHYWSCRSFAFPCDTHTPHKTPPNCRNRSIHSVSEFRFYYLAFIPNCYLL